MVDWTDKYYALAFPGTVGGGPGPVETVVLTVTATGATSANPVKAVADKAAFNAAVTADQERHNRFSDIVTFFMRHGIVVGVASNGSDTITLEFEQGSMFADGTFGRPDWLNKIERATAFELGAEYIAANDYSVSEIAVTINGVSQTA